VASSRIINVLGLARMYHARPSTFLCIEDEYTAFCFDEACGYIQLKLDNKEEPIFRNPKGEIEGKEHYSSFSELANKFE